VFDQLKVELAANGPFDCVLAKNLQALKWKLKKSQVGKPRPSKKQKKTAKKNSGRSRDLPVPKQPKRLKDGRKRRSRMLHGTIEFD